MDQLWYNLHVCNGDPGEHVGWNKSVQGIQLGGQLGTDVLEGDTGALVIVPEAARDLHAQEGVHLIVRDSIDAPISVRPGFDRMGRGGGVTVVRDDNEARLGLVDPGASGLLQLFEELEKGSHLAGFVTMSARSSAKALAPTPGVHPSGLMNCSSRHNQVSKKAVFQMLGPSTLPCLMPRPECLIENLQSPIV